MNITAILLLVCCLQVSARVSSQGITLDVKNAPLNKVFQEIKKQSGYTFIYTETLLKESNKVSMNVKNSPLQEVLSICFAFQPFTYKIINQTVVVQPKKKVEVNTVSIMTLPSPPPPIEIHGRVKDNNGNPLSNASVIIKGANQGVTTDKNGDFTISVPNAQTVLIISFTGYTSQEISVGTRTTINIQLSRSNNALNEVVVTALGLKQSAISTTYTSQAISGSEVNNVKDPNFMNSLAGKVAGAVITKGDLGPGSSSKVILRGNKSITGNNQPLYVIDGVPMSNANGPQTTSLIGQGTDGGDAISNLNPEDIESINILTGASASALYGSEAANGVILITTKHGRSGVSKVNVSSSVSLSTPMILPELQTSYGRGSKGVLNPAINDSWGPKIDHGSDAHLKDFFQKGHTYINSVSATNGNEKLQYYISYANTHANGIIPNNSYNRNNFTLKGTTHAFNDKLSLTGSVMYVNQIAKNRPSAGWVFSPIFSLYLFPVGDDFSKYSGSNYQKFDSTRNIYVQNWPYIRNEASSNQNPYWIQNKLQSDRSRNRTILNFTGKWDITNWLNLTGRATYDRTADDYERRLYASTELTQVGSNGSYTQNPTTIQQFYSDLLLSGNKKLGSDVSLSVTLGTTVTQNVYHDINLTTNGANTTLYYPNFFSVSGLAGLFTHSENLQKVLSQSVLGTATIGYKNTLFLNLTGRNEWSSTVNQPFFYPSAGLSYVLTNTTGASKVFSFVKLRGSYAEVGNALPFGVSNFKPNYTLAPDGNVNGRGSLPFFNGTDTTSLKPERSRSFEFGADIRLFNNNLSLNLTYYHATTFDQVFQIGAPAGSGATNFWINGGTILNKGVEAVLSYNASFGDFKWMPGVAFSKNVNEIRSLSDLLVADRYVLNSGFRIANLYLVSPGSPTLHGAKKYGSYGDLFGRTYQRDAQGNIQYGGDGLPLLSPKNDQYVGNASPDFLIGFTNSFNYKNFTLSFLIDSRFGGDIVSSTVQWMDFKGLSKRTGEARDAGGVMLNGKTIDAETYYQFLSGKADVSAATEAYVFDATNVRMRTLSLGYTFPHFSKVFKELNISLVGRNLFFLYKNAPFDPEVSITTANGMQGIDGFELPSTRSFSITLNATF